MICPIFSLLILQPSSICSRFPFPLMSLKVTRDILLGPNSTLVKEDTSTVEAVGDIPTNASGELGLSLFKKILGITLYITEVIC